MGTALQKLQRDLSVLVSDWRFEPPPGLGNAHVQTLLGAIAPRSDLRSLPPADRTLLTLSDGSRIALDCWWQTDRASAPCILLVHGMEGSSRSNYMLGIALKAFRRGYNSVRVNLRNCGDTEHLTETLYHAGRSEDISEVVEFLIAKQRQTRIAIAGVSLGGNVCLKLAGEWGTRAPSEVRALVAVSPVCDLTTSWQVLEMPRNVLYQWMFVRSFKKRIERKALLFPHRYDAAHLKGIRTVRQFDERYQAPLSGFAGADDYYRRASALPLVPRIQIPTLVLHAQDDPIVSVSPILRTEFSSNQQIVRFIAARGGHVGFFASETGKDPDRQWAENRIVEFCGWCLA